MSAAAMDSRHGQRAGAWRPDVWLCSAVAVLVSLGVVMVYSASSVYASGVYGNAEHFVWQQGVRVLMGVLALAVCVNVPGTMLAQRCGWLLLLSGVLCALVLIPGIGRLAGGARRWLEFGPVGFQPSEIAKVAVVVVLAALLSRRRQEKSAMSLLMPAILVQPLVALILLEPDLGTALVVELLVVLMVFVAGFNLRTIALLSLAGTALAYHFVVGTPFRLRRVFAYIDPWAYRQTVGYQVTEALISIGSGGVTGVGLGHSKHKLFFLPEAHTDFIFAIAGEELGFVGVLAILAAFAVVVWRGMRLSVVGVTVFDRYLAVGATALIGIPALFNMCVATGLVPTKGLPLPFLSYGGSNVVACLGAVGLLLRVDHDAAVGGAP